jgi:hypothetical protein
VRGILGHIPENMRPQVSFRSCTLVGASIMRDAPGAAAI